MVLRVYEAGAEIGVFLLEDWKIFNVKMACLISLSHSDRGNLVSQEHKPVIRCFSKVHISGSVAL